MKSTREKIIVGLMALAVLYFAYDFFLASPTGRNGNQTAGHDTILAVAADLQQQLAAGDFDQPPGTAAALAARERPWRPEKFVAADFALREPEAEPDQEELLRLEEVQAAAAALVYSGFLELGGKRLAVVSGSEYAVGDQINGLRLELIDEYFLELSLDEHRVRAPITDLDQGLVRPHSGRR